jgi:2-aminomuconate deaminase
VARWSVAAAARAAANGVDEENTDFTAANATSSPVGASARPGVAGAGAREAHIVAAAAPAPVGAFPHARRVGDLLYLSGIGPRQAGTNEIPGGPVRDPSGQPRDYDVAAQTRAVIDNVRTVLEAAGSSLAHVLDVTVFLIDMQRDFETVNRIYAETFAAIGATRTTVEVRALPTPIAVEFKVIARCGDGSP